MREIKIGNKIIGEGKPTFIIAEAGANHNRDYNMAIELIDSAAEAGADCVKFQTYSAETLYSKKTPDFKYLDGIAKQSTYDLLKSIEIPRDWQPKLKEYCDEKGIMFMSSPFDFQAIDELDEIDVPAFKIASFEIVDLPLIRYASEKGRPLIVSTGMSNYEEMQDVYNVCREAGNGNLILLQCASMYPAPVHISNLNSMKTIEQIFGLPSGYSDHTLGIHIPVAAVAAGAKVIEKHFTLDRKLPGPDHSFAIEPDELKDMVKFIRDTEKAMGDGRKLGPSPEEKENFEKGRRSIIAKDNIAAGEVITEERIIIKRPGYGIKPKFLDIVIGRKTKVAIEAEQWITWDMLG